MSSQETGRDISGIIHQVALNEKKRSANKANDKDNLEKATRHWRSYGGKTYCLSSQIMRHIELEKLLIGT